MIFDKGPGLHSRERTAYFSRWHLGNPISTHKRGGVNPYLTSHTKVNSKWIKDTNIIPKTGILRRKHRKKSFITIHLAKLLRSHPNKLLKREFRKQSHLK